MAVSVAYPLRQTAYPPGFDAVEMVAKGQEAETIIDLVEGETAQLRQNIFNKVFQKIEQGKLSPEEAVSHWQELYAAHKLLKRLQTAITIGKSAATMHPAALAGKENP